MIQKTYAITSLVDWKAQISAGKAKVIVHFTGGAITAYGITPAEYTTSNPFFQHVIENSDYFKNGRITLLREAEVADDASTKARKEREEERKEQTEKPVTVADERREAEQTSVEIGDANATDGDADAVSDGETDSDDGKTVVEASCREDVVEYLKTNFDYTATQLRTKGALMQALTEHNLVVVGFEL